MAWTVELWNWSSVCITETALWTSLKQSHTVRLLYCTTTLYPLPTFSHPRRKDQFAFRCALIPPTTFPPPVILHPPHALGPNLARSDLQLKCQHSTPCSSISEPQHLQCLFRQIKTQHCVLRLCRPPKSAKWNCIYFFRRTRRCAKGRSSVPRNCSASPSGKGE